MQKTDEPRSTPRNKLLAKVAESRFLTTSLLIHIALISMLGSVVLFKAAQDQKAFEVGDSNFLQDEAVAVETPTEDGQEFAEPDAVTEAAPITPATQSALGTLADTPASWNTTVSFDRMSIGTTLSSTPTMSSQAMGKGMTIGAIGPMGKPSSFSFMGIKSESRRVVFLLDASGSMVLDAKGGGQAYGELKDQLITLVDSMDPTTEFNVIMFGAGAADIFQPKAVGASKDNVTELKTWLAPYMREKAGLLKPTYSKSPFEGSWGTTRLDIALLAAFEMQAETIFILTDGTPNVGKAADADTIEKWEDNKRKNKSEFERYDKELAEYGVKHKDKIDAAKKKAAEMNASVKGRTQETYHWQSFVSDYPKAPPGYHRPSLRVDAKDFNELMKRLQLEIYLPKKMPMPTVNIVGYYVDEPSEDFLKDMTRGIPGKYKTFRK